MNVYRFVSEQKKLLAERVKSLCLFETYWMVNHDVDIFCVEKELHQWKEEFGAWCNDRNGNGVESAGGGNFHCEKCTVTFDPKLYVDEEKRCKSRISGDAHTYRCGRNSGHNGEHYDVEGATWKE